MHLLDWNSLGPFKLLTNVTVENSVFCLIVKSQKQNCYLICAYESIVKRNLEIVRDKNPELLIIPIIKNAHFSVCLVNFVTKSFCYVDSLYDARGLEFYFQFVKIMKIDKRSWAFFDVMDRDKQQNVIDCEVFVLQYVNRCLEGRNFLSLEEPVFYRDFIKNLLVKYRGDTQFCFRCPR